MDRIRIGHIYPSSPVMAAAGMAKSLPDVLRLSQSAAGAVLAGSAVGKEDGNAGNPQPTDFFDSRLNAYGNSRGLPDHPMGYYRNCLPEMVQAAHDQGKPFIWSISPLVDLGTTIPALCELAIEADVDVLEVNLGCPNVHLNGVQKDIASFDYEAIVWQVNLIADNWDKDIWLKMSVFSNPKQLERTATKIVNGLQRQYSERSFAVVSCNTFPNAFFVDGAGEQVIGAGFSGFSGPAFKPIALGQVKMWRSFLDERIPVIGAGGICTGRDVRDFLKHGAKAVQIGSAYPRTHERPEFFAEILGEYAELI